MLEKRLLGLDLNFYVSATSVGFGLIFSERLKFNIFAANLKRSSKTPQIVKKYRNQTLQRGKYPACFTENKAVLV